MNKIVKPVNANAQQEVCNVLAYLNEIAGKKVILGQHTQTMEQEELAFIYNVTNELRCFATINKYILFRSLYSSALAAFFYVNIYVFFCCILLCFT